MTSLAIHPSSLFRILNSMNCFAYLSFSVILKTSLTQMFYFMKNGVKETVEGEPDFNAEDKIKKVVVDLKGLYFVDSVRTPVSGE